MHTVFSEVESLYSELILRMNTRQSIQVMEDDLAAFGIGHYRRGEIPELWRSLVHKIVVAIRPFYRRLQNIRSQQGESIPLGFADPYSSDEEEVGSFRLRDAEPDNNLFRHNRNRSTRPQQERNFARSEERGRGHHNWGPVTDGIDDDFKTERKNLNNRVENPNDVAQDDMLDAAIRELEREEKKQEPPPSSQNNNTDDEFTNFMRTAMPGILNAVLSSLSSSRPPPLNNSNNNQTSIPPTMPIAHPTPQRVIPPVLGISALESSTVPSNEVTIDDVTASELLNDERLTRILRDTVRTFPRNE